jgi:hypothetical protein
VIFSHKAPKGALDAAKASAVLTTGRSRSAVVLGDPSSPSPRGHEQHFDFAVNDLERDGAGLAKRRGSAIMLRVHPELRR